MNILLINHYAGSPRHGMEFRPYYLAREWVRQGHRVQILAGAYSHIRAQQPQLPPAARGSWLDETIDGIDYRWYPMSPYQGNGLGRVGSILAFLWPLWRGAAALAQQLRPDLVIASSTYPMDIWPARRIARLAGARLVYEVHDLWPLSPMELGGMSRHHPFIRWVQWAEDLAYRDADQVISMLPLALPYMQSRGLAAHKFAHVPNGVDCDEWADPQPLPRELAERLQAIAALGRPLVGYAGSHGLANALDDLLDAARLLSGRAEVVLVGTGPQRARLAQRVQQQGLANVHLLPAVPKRAIPSLLQRFDLAYIGWHPNPLYRFGICPNKLMDYMMAARPIVHAVCAGNDPVAEAGCGLTVPPGDIAAIVQAIEQLLALPPGERAALGQAGRAYVLARHTYPHLAQQFLQALQREDTSRP